jgi:protein-tyrosine phosphatase
MSMNTTRRDLLLGGLALTAPLAAPAWALAPVQAGCERLADGRLRLDWAGPAMEVRLAERPDGPFTRVLARHADSGWSAEAPVRPRPYFRLTGRAGTTETAERVLPLQGGRNFRDLGGYRSADGRMVRWGQLYRSGSMVGLTEADYGYLSALGVKVICDFRSTAERQQEPTRWSGPQMIARDYDMDLASLRPAAGEAPSPEQMRGRMLQLYEELPYQQAESYRRMFAELAAGRTPLAFNCSAGKDRTGVAAALILTTLGVSRDQVLADYALTDKVVDYEAVMRRSNAAAGFTGVAAMAPELRRPMMRADPAYLQRALDTLAKREGSVEGFIRTRLGVTPAQTAALRARLLKRV